MFHPNDAALNKFVDGELPPSKRQRLKNHLITCDRCRNAVGEIRELVQLATQLPDAPVPRDLLWRILHASTDGHGAILPDPDTIRTATSPTRDALWKKTAVATTAMVLLLSTSVQDVVSESDYLSISPFHPTAGAKLRVRYRSTPGEKLPDSVVLRAEVVRENKPVWDGSREYLMLDTLVRSAKGEYQGEFEWPDGVMYAHMGVESIDGHSVDPDRRLDEPYLLHFDGKPALSALEQQFREYFRRGLWELNLQVARRMTENYQNAPSAWIAEATAALAVYGERVRDSVMAAHLPKLRELGNDPTRFNSPEWLGEMFWWAFTLEDPELERHWRDRVLKGGPLTRYAIEQRAIQIRSSSDVSAVEQFEQFDALWSMIGPREPIARLAFYAADEAGDGKNVAKWGPRYISFRPSERVAVAKAAMEYDESRRLAIRELRTALGELRDGRPNHRGLHRTVVEHNQNETTQQRRVASLLAQALDDEGRTSEASSFIEQAIQTGWDVDAFELGAKLRLESGDSLRAAKLLAQTFVDAYAVGDPYRSIDVLGQRIAPTQWSQFKVAAEARMFDQVLSESNELGSKADRVFVSDPNGWEVPLPEVLGNGVAVVAFVWKEQRKTIDSLVQLARAFDPNETRVIVLTGDLTDPAYRDLIAETPLLHWYHDSGARAGMFFETVHTPDFFVVDANASLQFHSSSFGDIRRQVAMLHRSRTTNGQALVAP